MRKRHFKLFVCFFAIIVSILSSSGVKAEEIFGLDSDGIPGVGEKDPCKDYSYVCIVNLAAVRVSYYENGTNFKGAIDIYENQTKKVTNKRDVTILKKNRIGNTTNKQSSEMDLGLKNQFSTFTSQSAQKKFYTGIWEKLSTNVEFVWKILKKLGCKESEKVTIFNNKKNRLVVEPLFRVRVQTIKDADNVYFHGTKPNWKYYIGTAYNISYLVVTDNKYGNGNVSGCNPVEEKKYCSRSEKGHVSRIANSLRVSEKVKIGGVTLKSPPVATRKKTKMRDVAKQENGYGIAIVKFNYDNYNDEPEGESKSVCYKAEENCDVEQNGSVTFSQDTDEDSTASDVSTCASNSYTQSQYGIRSEKINDYCSWYCKKNKAYTVPSGLKNSGFDLTTSETSASYFNNFLIEAEETMTCKVDFNYVYGTNQAVNEVFGNKATVTEAEKQLAEAYMEYYNYRTTNNKTPEVCKQEARAKRCLNENGAISNEAACNMMGSYNGQNNCGDYYGKYLLTLRRIKDGYVDCGNATMDESATTLREPIIEASNLQLKKDHAEAKIEGNHTGDVIKTNDNICGGDCFNQFCADWNGDTAAGFMGINGLSGPCQILIHFQPSVLAKRAVTLTTRDFYAIKSNINYNENNTDNEGDVGNYNKPAGETKTYSGVCANASKYNANTSKQSENTLPIKFGDSDIKKYCKIDTAFIPVEYTSKSFSCPCPPETKNSGKNAYLWISRKDGLSQSLLDEFNNGIKCSEAIKKVCSLTPPSDSGSGYEQILGEDQETVIDGCLSVGIPYKVCYTEANRAASCKDGVDITNQVWQYIANNTENLSNLQITDTIWNNAAEIVSKSADACPCDNPDEPVKPNFVYRTIGLGNKKLSFPGINGNGRKAGSNWSDTDIQTVLTDHKDIYKGEPMYKIVLTPETIKKVRNYNKMTNKQYGEYLNMTCNNDGSACVSSFLNDSTYNVTGKCASVTKLKESFYGASCVNYYSYGS